MLSAGCAGGPRPGRGSRRDGRRLADGASFLLPYYLGRYHKFIE